MNNYEKIKTMTLEEMVKLNQYAYSDCLIKIFSGKETECPAMRFREDDAFCDNCFKQWLQQETKN